MDSGVALSKLYTLSYRGQSLCVHHSLQKAAANATLSWFTAELSQTRNHCASLQTSALRELSLCQLHWTQQSRKQNQVNALWKSSWPKTKLQLIEYILAKHRTCFIFKSSWKILSYPPWVTNRISLGKTSFLLNLFVLCLNFYIIALTMSLDKFVWSWLFSEAVTFMLHYLQSLHE